MRAFKEARVFLFEEKKQWIHNQALTMVDHSGHGSEDPLKAWDPLSGNFLGSCSAFATDMLFYFFNWGLMILSKKATHLFKNDCLDGKDGYKFFHSLAIRRWA